MTQSATNHVRRGRPRRESGLEFFAPVSAVAPSNEERAAAWDELGLRWINWGYPALFTLLGLVAAGAVLAGTSERRALGTALILLSLAPWVATFAGHFLRHDLFGLAVIAPLGVLLIVGPPLHMVDLGGGAQQLGLLLIIGILGQTASIGDDRSIRVVAIVSFVVLIGATATVDRPFDLAPWYVGFALALGGGLALRANAVHMLRTRRAEEALAGQRLDAERRRIARDVHDVVAHSMAVTMLHLTAARMAVKHDPDSALEALEEAERQGRASMDDIRTVVRLLRGDDSVEDAPMPGLRDLPDLIESARSAGIDVELTVDGEGTEIGSAVAVAVYRVVQETLTNATRHGSGRIEIAVTVAADHVVVAATNPFVASSTTQGGRPAGAGLAGMAERVESLGGRFTAAPRGQVWVVQVTVPAVRA